MRDVFYSFSDHYLFLILSCTTILFSLLAVYLVSRYIPVHVRDKDNAVLGNVSQLIGLIYGVLAGLMALYLINNITYTSDAVQREANAAADLYRETEWLKEPTKMNIQTQIKNYIYNVINIEWPLMKSNKNINNGNDKIIYQITGELRQYPIATEGESLIIREMVEEVKALNDAREQRITMSYTALNGHIWIVIVLGTILMLSINYLFGMHFYLHLFTVGAIALMASSMIYLLLTLDRPFQGEFSVEPKAFLSVLEHIENKFFSLPVAKK